MQNTHLLALSKALFVINTVQNRKETVAKWNYSTTSCDFKIL